MGALAKLYVCGLVMNKIHSNVIIFLCYQKCSNSWIFGKTKHGKKNENWNIWFLSFISFLNNSLTIASLYVCVRFFALLMLFDCSLASKWNLFSVIVAFCLDIFAFSLLWNNISFMILEWMVSCWAQKRKNK